MAGDRLSEPDKNINLDISSTSTMVPLSGNSSTSGFAEKVSQLAEEDIAESRIDFQNTPPSHTTFAKDFHEHTEATYSSMWPYSKPRFKARLKPLFAPE
jgi:hypothetical protein